MMTDPTADAAKLLPCTICGGISIHLNQCPNTRPQPAPPEGEALSDAQIKHMIDRFLGWRLPKPWHPDNGISYVRPNYMHPPADHDWPTGTNLFDWSQTEAMVRYMAEGMPSLAARPKVEDAEVVAHVALLRMLGCVGGQLDHAAVRKAADLLEERAGIVSDQRDYIQRLERLLNEASNQRDSANDKLAATEAELAKADAALVIMDDFVPENFDWPEWVSDAFEASCERHAARQQQRASAGPTEREVE